MGERRTLEDATELIREYGIGFVTPFGYGEGPYTDPVEAAEVANELQEVALEETRLGVPILIPVDAVHGHAYVAETAIFPHNVGLAATRDVELAERVGTVTAREVAATGASLTYGPTCDVAREPRWGRTFETFGESPHLCGEFGAAKARGAAAADADVARMAKHFPAYGEPERGEDASPVDRSRSSIVRDFRSSFEPILEEGIEGVMPCYNSINGAPAHGSGGFLTETLREELGFDGYVASDWNGVRMLHEDHRVAPTVEDAIRRALEAGVDVHSLGGAEHVEHVESLVESGELDEAVVDRAVRRVLELKRSVGLFDDPFVDTDETATTVGDADHRAAALEAARESMTLLENDGLLPLDPDVDEVLVTGPNADDLRNQVGGWSLHGEGQVAGTTVREGLEAVLEDATVTHERGAGIDEPDDLDGAVAAAEEADVAVVVLGENWYRHEFGPMDVNGPPRTSRTGRSCRCRPPSGSCSRRSTRRGRRRCS